MDRDHRRYVGAATDTTFLRYTYWLVPVWVYNTNSNYTEVNEKGIR